jgi:hypothetical protein
MPKTKRLLLQIGISSQEKRWLRDMARRNHDRSPQMYARRILFKQTPALVAIVKSLYGILAIPDAEKRQQALESLARDIDEL